MYLKFFLAEDKGLFSYHGCWWSRDTKCQTIISNDREYPNINTGRANMINQSMWPPNVTWHHASCFQSSHFLNQCWRIVNWNMGNIPQWNLDENTIIFIQQNTFENVLCNIVAISLRPQTGKTILLPGKGWVYMTTNEPINTGLLPLLLGCLFIQSFHMLWITCLISHWDPLGGCESQDKITHKHDIES